MSETIVKTLPEEQDNKTTIKSIPKKKKKKVRYKEFHKRQFLNLPDKESNAFISARMTNERWNGYLIRIADCNEKITLHGSLIQLKSRKNALHKVDTLIETLQELREHMVSEFERNNLKH